jgi:E3 ubiquitin-protein ligase mind-bomb
LQLARQLVDVKKEDGFSGLHLAALNGHSLVCEVLVKEGLADINIRNDRRQTPFLLAVSQGHAAAVEKLVELGCDILAKDEDGDNAMHLTIIKKANLVQEVPQQEAPKIYEIYQQLAHIQEHRLMYTLLCYLAQEGCKMEPNYKGARIFDWIPEQEIREIILSFEKKRIVPANNSIINASSSSSNDCNQSRDMSELYNNIEMMNLTSQDSSTTLTTASTTEQENSSGSSLMANLNATSGSNSNPPTPARRNRNNNISVNSNNNNINNNRNDTASPLTAAATSSSGVVQLSEDEKKINNEIRSQNQHTISPPLPHAEPTTSSNVISSDTSSSSPNRNNSHSPPLPMPQQHVSRKQQQPRPQLPFNGKPQLQTPQECIVCNEMCLMITFEPCCHSICCEDCGMRMKKCLQCQNVIEKRIAMNGKMLMAKESQRQPSADRLRYLESKILEIEETHSCGICMERRRNVAFLCGHSACSKCAETLKTCHM